LEYLDIILDHLKSNSVIIDYFLAYPLKGKKQTALWKYIRARSRSRSRSRSRKMLFTGTGTGTGAPEKIQAGGIELIREKAKSINN
jgi:hypothetical protein